MKHIRLAKVLKCIRETTIIISSIRPVAYQQAGRLYYVLKNIYGPYEWKTVLAQGNSPVNGPHQGAWVDTPTGEDWFLHFQDVGAYGRIMHLQPMKWVNDWPVIGIDKDGDGCGEPVLTYKKPNVGQTYPICTPQESDEFDGYTLSPQWQWHANINEKWAYYAGDQSIVRLYSYPVVKEYKNLWDAANLLLPKNSFRQLYRHNEADLQTDGEIQRRTYRTGSYGT